MNAIRFFKKTSFKTFISFSLFIVHFSFSNAQFWPPQGMLGDGSQGNPYQITDSSHLRILADFVNANYQNGYATKNKYYQLMNNIDLVGYSNWNPIGIFPSDFEGVFDGNGYIVQNLTVNRPTENDAGLFAQIRYGAIKNLGVINCNIVGKNYVGGLVANAAGIISNCYATGSVSGDRFVGGLVGFSAYSSIISNCYAICNVSGNDERIGGLAGSVDTYSIIDSCYATGNVSGNTWYVGGLAGFSQCCTITNCYATGNVSGGGSGYGIGGLVGHAYTSGAQPLLISNCYATGNVSGRNKWIGGLIGYNYCTYANGGGEGGKIYNHIISYCYATGNVSGDSNQIGGLIGHNSNAAIRSCVAANNSVVAISNTTDINRIVGYNDGGVCQNNYALNSMVVQNSNGNVAIANGLNTNSGAGVPLPTLKDSVFYSTWSNWYNYVPWNIDSVTHAWKICNGQNLPFLRWQGILCPTDYHTITAAVGSNGSINSSGTNIVIKGTNLTFTFTANICYKTDSLWIDGVYSPDSIVVGSYTFNNVTKNHTIKVSFKKIEYFTSFADTTCSNETYLFGNHTLTSSGTYYDTLQNINGCDSVIELNLTVNPATFMSDSVAICEGDFYDFHGKLLSVADIYYDTLQTIHGCDSIFELILTVNPLPEIPTITKTDNILTSSASDSYQWYCNGVSILSATFQSYIYTENGKYSVAVTNEFGCTTISEEMDVNDVGIVETHCNASLRVYPNPAGNQLTIEYGSSACFGYAQQPTLTAQERPLSEVEVEIYSVVGQKVLAPPTPLRGELEPSSNAGNSPLEGGLRGATIDISHLVNGMYFLKIGNRTARFVKE